MRLIAIMLAVISVAPSAKLHDVGAFAVAASHMPVDHADLIALAHIETGGTYRSDLTSSAGACGVLQVMPRWSSFSCADMRQPLAGVAAGAISWAYWSRRKGAAAARHYNAGNNPTANEQRARRSAAYQAAFGRIRRSLLMSPRTAEGQGRRF